MKQPNATLLEKIYSDFAKQDFNAVISSCDEKMTFQIAGKSRLAGKFDRSNFATGFATKLIELSGGTFKSEVHDILASDLHAAVLATNRLTREGKMIEMRTVHIWRFQNGKPIAWYEYPRDLYQYDTVWA